MPRKLVGSSPDLARAIREVPEQGVTFVSAAVSPVACTTLLREVDDGAFRPQPGTIGPVRQCLDTLELGDRLESFPAVAQLREELAAAVDRHAAPGSPLRRWQPNDVSVLRYRPTADVGITPHLDGRRYGLLVAVVTIAGRARFSLHLDRDGEPVRTWLVVPGSLMLLRGPGLTGPDERPFHSVSPPLDRNPRYSIGFRMNTRPEEPDR